MALPLACPCQKDDRARRERVREQVHRRREDHERRRPDRPHETVLDFMAKVAFKNSPAG